MHVLSSETAVFLRKVLQVETHSKKGDSLEAKTLVRRNGRTEAGLGLSKGICNPCSQFPA